MLHPEQLNQVNFLVTQNLNQLSWERIPRDTQYCDEKHYADGAVKPIKEWVMEASGAFTVAFENLSMELSGPEATQFGRMGLVKQYSGDLEGQSRGQMMSCRLDNGSAGYVAMEWVEGQLNGQKGQFLLQHFGTMNAKHQRLILEVVPGSGTDELAGLTGTMAITIEDGQHFYQFEYSLT